MTTPAITGTISHGTLRPEDLIPAFHSALIALGGRLPESAWESMERFDDGTIPQTGEDLADFHEWLLDDLYGSINSVLPEGWYFGAIEGDGSDFGIFEVDHGVSGTYWRGE